MEEGVLFQRKRSSTIDQDDVLGNKSGESQKFDVKKLTLLEEIYLLGLNNKSGVISLWNTSVSSGLRGCILVELSFLGRIELESCNMRTKKLQNRIVKLKNDDPIDDPILAEALKTIKNAGPETLLNWIEYFNGESWNPMKLGYALKNVRERIAKTLVEKGILTTSKGNFFIFEYVTHPLVDSKVKAKLIQKVQNSLLQDWINDPQRFDPRVLAMLYLAHIGEVLDGCLTDLNDNDYNIATARMDELLEVDFELESLRDYNNDVLWGVLCVFLK